MGSRKGGGKEEERKEGGCGCTKKYVFFRKKL
jgi:hypothetical protein